MMNPYHIVENAIHIAWDYLERTGELGNPEVASELLLREIQDMMRSGEYRPLMLSNRAIDAYKKYRNHLALVS
jgi:hypothetical protein